MGGINANLRHDLFQGLDCFLQRYLVWVVIRRVLLYVCSVGGGGRKKKKIEFVGERNHGKKGKRVPRTRRQVWREKDEEEEKTQGGT